MSNRYSTGEKRKQLPSALTLTLRKSTKTLLRDCPATRNTKEEPGKLDTEYASKRGSV